MSSTRSRPTVIALVDANGYYIACERLFAPRLEGKPVVVLSNNDGNAVAVSEEAKALGIVRGAPAHELRPLIRRCGLRMLSSNYAVYGDLSARLMTVLGHFAPRLEIYSIDEAFLDWSGLDEAAALEGAREIVRAVRQWLGLPVSVGIGPTKVLAKVANRIAKKQKIPGGAVALLDRGRQTEALAGLPTAELWGIAGRWAAKLGALGIDTALPLREADPPWLRSVFGVVMERIAYELRGISCLALEEVAPAKQQIVASRSFGRPVLALDELKVLVHEKKSYLSYTHFMDTKQYSGARTRARKAYEHRTPLKVVPIRMSEEGRAMLERLEGKYGGKRQAVEAGLRALEEKP